MTAEGHTARLLSACRPLATILAATPDPGVAGSLAMSWGVLPFVTAERQVDRLSLELIERRLLAPGATVVFINVNPDEARPDSNFLHVRRLSAPGTP